MRSLTLSFLPTVCDACFLKKWNAIWYVWLFQASSVLKGKRVRASREV